MMIAETVLTIVRLLLRLLGPVMPRLVAMAADRHRRLRTSLRAAQASHVQDRRPRT